MAHYTVPLQQIFYIRKRDYSKTAHAGSKKQNTEWKRRLIRKFLQNSLRRSKGGGLKLMGNALAVCEPFVPNFLLRTFWLL
jgi:hypothetical protein